VPRALDLSIDRASDIPIGTQLIWKLRTLVATGALPPGAKLPGIREVAGSAGINVNTVRSVFARLEEQGLLVSEQGRGTFVAPGARQDAELSEAAAKAIANALAAGVDPRELAAVLYVSPQRLQERDERRTLYAQIKRLEAEVGRLDPPRARERRPDAEPQPRMLTVAELRNVRDQLELRVDQLIRERQEWRVEAEQLRAAERQELEREASHARAHPWKAGMWTGRAGAAVSWTKG
jgi:DNA-binding transcriptional regulator YhcF (GntR family)